MSLPLANRLEQLEKIQECQTSLLLLFIYFIITFEPQTLFREGTGSPEDTFVLSLLPVYGLVAVRLGTSRSLPGAACACNCPLIST